MTKSELWKIYTDKNPQFLDENEQITLTVRGLKKMFDQTWDKAEEHTQKKADVFRDMFKAFK